MGSVPVHNLELPGARPSVGTVTIKFARIYFVRDLYLKI